MLVEDFPVVSFFVDCNPVIQVPVFRFHGEIHTPAIKQRWHFSQMFSHHLFLSCQTWFERSVSRQHPDRFNSFIQTASSVIPMNEHNDLELQNRCIIHQGWGRIHSCSGAACFSFSHGYFCPYVLGAIENSPFDDCWYLKLLT